MATEIKRRAGSKELSATPLTLEGSAVLHQMFRLRRAEWKRLPQAEQARALRAAEEVLRPLEESGESALFSMLGHKGDLLFIHFRKSLDEIHVVELRLAQTPLWEFLEPATSFLSVVELGLYDSSVKLYRKLAEEGVGPHSAEWKRAVEEVLERQREAMRPRLYPKVPAMRYVSFYPMDRKRGEERNWYTLPIEERQRQMEEHGQVGRRYAGQVQQIISGAIGFDDWEWGVDLFADDPVVFKRLIYEMRFDEVSAVYALFGTFYLGIRCPSKELGGLLEGKLPQGGRSGGGPC